MGFSPRLRMNWVGVAERRMTRQNVCQGPKRHSTTRVPRAVIVIFSSILVAWL